MAKRKKKQWEVDSSEPPWMSSALLKMIKEMSWGGEVPMPSPAAMIKRKGCVEYEPSNKSIVEQVETKKETNKMSKGPETTLEFSSELMKSTYPMLDQILKNTLEVAERQAHRIIEAAQKSADSMARVVAVQTPDGKVIKLSSPAHPLLEDIANLSNKGLLPLLVGPAGSGKSTLAADVAKALGVPFGHICFSAGVSEVWLFGRHTPAGFKEAEFSRMYREGGVFLADELDAADANVLLAVNTALSSDVLYNPMSGETIKKHEDFHFIGAANTYGKGASGTYVGRNRLDAATLDRFVCINVDYLAAIEDSLCPEKKISVVLRAIRAHLVKEGSQEVVSYRCFDKAFKLHQMGFGKDRIWSILFASWPRDLYKRVCG